MLIFDDTLRHPIGCSGSVRRELKELLAYLHSYRHVIYIIGHGHVRQIRCFGA